MHFCCIQAVWKLKEVHQCVKNQWTFANNIVKRNKLNHSPENVPRILQTLAITVLYQLVGFAFSNKLNVLQARVFTYNSKMQQKRSTNKNTQLYRMFHTLKAKFFGSFVAKSKDAPAGYQTLFGYNVFIKLLILKATKVKSLELHSESQEEKEIRKPAAKLPKKQTGKRAVNRKPKEVLLTREVLSQAATMTVLEEVLDRKFDEKLALQDERNVKLVSGFRSISF